MDNPRFYGNAPFGVAVVHGGPGAAGEVADVARALSAGGRGVIEPLQTAATLEGQVRELHGLLAAHAARPATLIGWSWGAWLAYLVAARDPAAVRKLVLVSSGPFEDRYVPAIRATRLGRLSDGERAEMIAIEKALDDPAAAVTDGLLARLGELCGKADAYAPLPAGDEVVDVRADIYRGVWEEAAALRRSGGLLELAARIRCPVVAVHGDYDPHPYRGVVDPLAKALTDFRSILLARCGHTPWREQKARTAFFAVMKRELPPGKPRS
jgi:pimeloyl-ACP methyl ester carboxylesterase